jgi:hypothetical protein
MHSRWFGTFQLATDSPKCYTPATESRLCQLAHSFLLKGNGCFLLRWVSSMLSVEMIRKGGGWMLYWVMISIKIVGWILIIFRIISILIGCWSTYICLTLQTHEQIDLKKYGYYLKVFWLTVLFFSLSFVFENLLLFVVK